MNISDINYLEVADKEANVVGGSILSFKAGKLIKEFDIRKNLTKSLTFSGVVLHGNKAEGQVGASALGYNTYTAGSAYTETTPYSSLTVVKSESASSY